MVWRCGVLLILFQLLGCATPGGVYVEGLDRSLLDLQKIAAKSLPLGLRKQSTNGREYFSNYFTTSKRKFRPAQKSKDRSYAQILVLGDRRPYKMQVLVHNEKLSPQGYLPAGTDLRIAKVIKRRVSDQLSKRREDLNFIDDFRVF